MTLFVEAKIFIYNPTHFISTWANNPVRPKLSVEGICHHCKCIFQNSHCHKGNSARVIVNAGPHLDLQGGYSSAQESGKDLQGKEKSNPEDTVTTRCDGTAGAKLTPLVFPDFGAENVPHTMVTWHHFLIREDVTWALGEVSC